MNIEIDEPVVSGTVAGVLIALSIGLVVCCAVAVHLWRKVDYLEKRLDRINPPQIVVEQ